MAKTFKNLVAASLRRLADKIDPRECIDTLPMESGVRYEGKEYQVVPLRGTAVARSRFEEDQLIYNAKVTACGLEREIVAAIDKAVVISQTRLNANEIRLDGLLLILAPKLDLCE